jgi:hypothetical protein
MEADAEMQALPDPYAEEAPQDPYSGLSEEDRRRLFTIVDDLYIAAYSGRAELDARVAVVRKHISLQDSEQVVTPLTASRYRAIRSLIWQIFTRTKPLFSAVPRTGEATDTARIYEAAMQAEIRAHYPEIQKAMSEAAAVPLGVAYVYTTPSEYEPDQLDPKVEAVPIEDFMVYPTGSTDWRKSTTFHRHRTSYWELEELAEDGYYDLDAVARLAGATTVTPTAGQEVTATEDTISVSATGHQIVEYWCTYLLWRPQAGKRSELWRVYWSKDDNVILRAEPAKNHLPPDVDRPPYVPFNSEQVIGSVYSLPPTFIVSKFQAIQDELYNSLLEEGRYSTDPAFVTNDQRMFNYLTTPEGRFGSNKIYYKSGAIDETALRRIDLPPNQSTLLLMQFNKAEAEQAMPSSSSLPPGTRASAAAVERVASSSGSLLAELINSIKVGADQLADMFWRFLRHAKYSEVPKVLFDSKRFNPTTGSQESPQDPAMQSPSAMMLLGPQDLQVKAPDVPATMSAVEALSSALTKMGLPPQAADALSGQIASQFPETGILRVHSAFRNDVVWEVTSTETQSEVQQRRMGIQIMLQFVNLIVAANPGAAPAAIWALLNDLADSYGLLDKADWLKRQPPAADAAWLERGMALVQSLGFQRMGAYQEQGDTGGTG